MAWSNYVRCCFYLLCLKLLDVGEISYWLNNLYSSFLPALVRSLPAGVRSLLAGVHSLPAGVRSLPAVIRSFSANDVASK